MGKTSPSCFVPGVKRDEMILAQAGGHHTHITGHYIRQNLHFSSQLTCPLMLMYVRVCWNIHVCAFVLRERKNREPTSEMETLLSLGYETLLGKSVTCGVWRAVLRALSALTALAQQTRLANRDNKTFDNF